MPRIASRTPKVAQQQHPVDCQCCRASAPAQQSLDELAFAKSACAAAKSGDVEKLRRLINKEPRCVHSDGCGGVRRCESCIRRRVRWISFTQLGFGFDL